MKHALVALAMMIVIIVFAIGFQPSFDEYHVQKASICTDHGGVPVDEMGYYGKFYLLCMKPDGSVFVKERYVK